MTSQAINPPEHNQYRVTFFFGPEPVPDRPDRTYCVFNVKKRSWKGGVQVSVEIDQHQVDRLREHLAYQTWVTNMLQHTTGEERSLMLQRAEDLFIQALCACKLDLAMLQGLEQTNQTLPAERLTLELDQVATNQHGKVTDYVRAELGLIAEM